MSDRPTSDWDLGYLGDVDATTLIDAFLHFRLEVVTFWCDAGPVIRAAQADVLASLT